MVVKSKIRRLRRVASDKGGNVAMMFAISAVGMLTVVGAAVDYSGMTKSRMMLQHQVDAAVLAAARLQPAPGKKAVKKKDRKKVVYDVLAQNGYDLAYSQPKVRINNPAITVRATAPYKTVFMGLIGKNTVDLNVIAKSQINAGNTVEIALVLDNTGSMGVDGKLEALQSGAKGLLGTLSGFQDGKVKVAIVPFAKNINVGVDKRGASWLDLPDEYTVTRPETVTTYTGGTKGDCVTTTVNTTRDGVPYSYPSETCTGGTPGTPTTTTSDRDYVAEWEGCVGARPSELHISDDTYSTRIPGLTGFEAREYIPETFDLYHRCPEPITDLTNDFAVLNDGIDAMSTSDTTYMPLGITWGRRVLSAHEPFGQATSGDNVRKMMVLMTDGLNTVHLDKPPYLKDNRTSTATSLVEKTNQDTVEACRRAKADNIEIVTIAFRVTDAATRQILQSCASGVKNYYNAGDNNALIQTFQKIGASLNEVRLTQ